MDLAPYYSRITAASLYGRCGERLDLTSVYKSLFWSEAPLAMLTSNMNYLYNLSNCCRNFNDDSRGHKTESDNEHSIRSKITDILNSLLRDPSLLDSIVHELCNMIMEVNAVHANVHEVSRQAAGVATKMFHNVRMGKSLLVQHQRLQRNRAELGKSIYRAFSRTTRYTKVLNQVCYLF